MAPVRSWKEFSRTPAAYFFLANQYGRADNGISLRGPYLNKEANMDHNTKPLIRSHILVTIGVLFVVCITLFGILNNPGEIIRQDVLMGPIIAAGRIVVPLLFSIGLLFLFANIKKCKHCGKILFWKRPRN